MTAAAIIYGVTLPVRDRFRGDQWNFSFSHLSPARVPIDMTGSNIDAKLTWRGNGVLPVLSILADEDDDRTGVLWTNIAEGKYILKINEADTTRIPASRGEEDNANLVVRVVDSAGNRTTRVVMPIRVLA